MVATYAKAQATIADGGGGGGGGASRALCAGAQIDGTQDLSVLVTQGARARGVRVRGPRPEARGARARGPRSEVRDCGVSARSQPKVCVTREVANKYSCESILHLS